MSAAALPPFRHHRRSGTKTVSRHMDVVDFPNHLAVMGGLLTLMIREHDVMLEDCDRMRGVSKDRRRRKRQWAKFS